MPSILPEPSSHPNGCVWTCVLTKNAMFLSQVRRVGMTENPALATGADEMGAHPRGSLSPSRLVLEGAMALW